jgi:hypothetical protein
VASTAVRKGKAEDSVNDKLATMADAIAQLAMAQKDMTDQGSSQRHQVAGRGDQGLARIDTRWRESEDAQRGHRKW